MGRKADILYETLFGGMHSCCLCTEEAFIGEDGLCDSCRSQVKLCISPANIEGLDGFYAGLLYTDNISSAIYRYKKREHYYLGSFFAQYMHIPASWHGELLVPVPLHWTTKLLRHFNQSHDLSLYLSSEYGLPVCAPLLKKIKRTRQQKELNAKERSKNLRKAFLAAPEVKGRSIILVDDVCTTGATLSACAKALRKAGAVRVYAITATAVMR